LTSLARFAYAIGVGWFAAAVFWLVFVFYFNRFASSFDKINLLEKTGVGDRWRRWIRRRRLDQFGDELAEELPMLVRCARSGYVPLEIIRFAAVEADSLLVSEVFSDVCDNFAIGVGLEDALWKVYEEMPHPLFFRFITALQFARSSGGDASASLEALADLVRSQKLLKREIREESTEARYSAILVAALPIVLTVYTVATSPEMLHPLLNTANGKTMLGYAIISWFIGLLYLRRSLNFGKGDWI